MLSLSISKNDRLLYHRAIGDLKIAGTTTIKATPDTKYRIGSVSKMFTSVIIFQLIEEKKLTLTTPLATFFPQIPNAASITIGQMLNHHSGIHDFTHDSTFREWMLKPHTEKQLVDIICSSPATFEPGTKGEYSNSNFVLLGFIIEKVTGATYENQLTKRIIRKIGLKNTAYGKAINAKAGEAASYHFSNASWEEYPESDMSVPGGAGAIISTPDDLNRFLNALFGGKLINDASLQTMTTITEGYGYGIFKNPFNKLFSYGHNGRIDGFVSDIAFFPKDSMSFAIVANGINYDLNSIVIGVLSIYYNMPYTIPSFKTIKVSPEILAAYEGNYSSKEIPIKFTVKVDDGVLTAQASGQSAFPLEALSESKFQFDAAGIEINFHKSSANKVDSLTIVQGGHALGFSKD